MRPAGRRRGGWSERGLVLAGRGSPGPVHPAEEDERTEADARPAEAAQEDATGRGPLLSVLNAVTVLVKVPVADAVRRVQETVEQISVRLGADSIHRDA